MQKWFKMPAGAANNPALAIAAKKIEVPKIAVFACFSIFCELLEQKKEKSEIIELTAFTLDIPDATVAEIFDALEARKLFPDFEQRTPAADRQRAYRERQREGQNVTRDASVDNAEITRGVTRDAKTRPEREKERKTPLPPSAPVTPVVTPEQPTAQGSGSFQGIGGVVGRVAGGAGAAFDIREHLADDDFVEVRPYMLGRDPKFMFDKFNAFFGDNPPRNPKAAFIGWCKKFTQGKRA